MSDKIGLKSRIYDQFKERSATSFRHDRRFHPSALAGDFCPRSWVLRNYHPEAAKVHARSVKLDTSRRFAHGHAMHDKIQGLLGELGVLWGQWHLEEEPGRTVIGFPPAGRRARYGEFQVRHDPDRITGHIDGLIRLDGKKYGIELKSINPYWYSMLDSGPRPEHAEQTLIYMHCLRWMHEAKEKKENGLDFIDDFDAQPLDGFVILYENMESLVIREFEVPASPRMMDDVIGEKRLLMDEALEFERSRRLPKCRCTTKSRAYLCKGLGSDPFRSATSVRSKSKGETSRGRSIPGLRSTPGRPSSRGNARHTFTDNICTTCGVTRRAVDHFGWDYCNGAPLSTAGSRHATGRQGEPAATGALRVRRKTTVTLVGFSDPDCFACNDGSGEWMYELVLSRAPSADWKAAFAEAYSGIVKAHVYSDRIIVRAWPHLMKIIFDRIEAAVERASRTAKV